MSAVKLIKDKIAVHSATETVKSPKTAVSSKVETVKPSKKAVPKKSVKKENIK